MALHIPLISSFFRSSFLTSYSSFISFTRRAPGLMIRPVLLGKPKRFPKLYWGLLRFSACIAFPDHPLRLRFVLPDCKRIAEIGIRTRDLIHDLENSALDRSTTVGRLTLTYLWLKHWLKNVQFLPYKYYE